MSDDALVVRKVENKADMEAFLRFPWACYEGDPYWVPPLFSEHRAYFDREKNPELHHIDIDYFVAWRGETVVGIIAAFVNHAYNEFHGENLGWFGAFEVLDDREAGHALLSTAESWCREKGTDAVRGPATFSTNSEIGLLVEGFDYPPMILTTYAHRYYQDFVESAGYEKEMDLWAYRMDARPLGGRKADKLPERLVRVMEKLGKRYNFTLRKLNLRDFDNELRRLKKIYNSAWEQNWGFVPLSDAEIDKLAHDLKQFVDVDISFFVEVDGEPIAFSVPLPNIYEPLRLAYPRPDEPEIFALLRLLWHWKVRRRLSGVRVFTMGVVKEYRGKGLDGFMILEMLKNGLPKGYLDNEMSWLLETNEMVVRSSSLAGGEHYKTYRVYQKPL
jgi:hypothetical protein